MRIVAATGNPGKLAELNALAPRGWEVIAQSEFACDAADENAVTFVENALIKARHACARAGLPAIADDSGLEVDALGGAPGVHSARYAGADGDDASAANIDKLLTELTAAGATQSQQRRAKFRCVLVFMRGETDPAPLIADGVWSGHIATAPAGAGGFGYDPVFVVDARGTTAAQLTAVEKNRISHRAKALRNLRELLRAESKSLQPS